MKKNQLFKRISSISVVVCGLTMISTLAYASSMNALMKNKWQGSGASNAEVLPSALNKCKLNMKNNSVVCLSDPIEKTTKIAELVYTTEAEIGNFKGKSFTISFRRNYTYIMGTDLDDPDAPLPKEQTGWEKTKTVLKCKIAKGKGVVTCTDNTNKEVKFSKM